MRMVVVDDHLAFGEALAVALEPDHTILTVLSNGEELLRFLSEISVDAVLLDSTLPHCDMRSLIQSVRRSSSALLIVMTSSDTRGVWPGLHRGGAHGAIPKSRTLSAFRDSIQEISSLGRPLEDTEVWPVSSSLTPRQEDVLKAIARDLLRKEIAMELSLSEARINEHVAELKRRFRVRTTAGVVLRGIEEGLIEPRVASAGIDGSSASFPA